MESFSVIWCSFLLVNVQFLVSKVDANITWTLPSPQRGPLSNTDISVRTTFKVLDGSSSELRLEWDFTLSNNSLIRVSWRIDSNDLIGTKTASGVVTLFPVFQGKFSISRNDRATLIIHNATAADGKGIKCTVTTDARDWSDVISVIIKVPAKIHQIRGEQTVLEGGNLQLTCKASSKPEANITWTKEKTGNHGNSVLQEGKVLTITNVSRNDSGTFNCTAYNGFGEADSQTVHVNVTYPPKIVKIKTECFVGVKQSVTLICEAEGNPPATYSWIPCDSEQGCDKNTLHISQVLNDVNYTCKVANVHGNDSKTANVYIGGHVINITIVITSETCINGKYNQSLLLDKFKELLEQAFADKPGYEGVQLIGVRCGSITVDLALTFNSTTKEQDVLITLNDAAKDGKLEEFIVSAIKGTRPDVEPTSRGTPTPTDGSSEASAKIPNFQSEYIAFVHQSLTLNCEAEGNPPPTYTWTPCDSEQVCDKNTLHISQVLNDTSYTCRVANIYGNESKTANVYIGGNVINITIVITSETFIDGKYNQSLLLEKFKELFEEAFGNKTGYEGVQLIGVRCGSIIVDLALKFNLITKEQDVIRTLYGAVKGGKLQGFRIGAIKGKRPDMNSTSKGTLTPTVGSSGGIAWWIILIIVLAVVIVLILVVILVKKKGSCSLPVNNGKRPRG